MKFFLFQTLEFDLSLLIDSNSLSYFFKIILMYRYFVKKYINFLYFQTKEIFKKISISILFIITTW